MDRGIEERIAIALEAIVLELRRMRRYDSFWTKMDGGVYAMDEGRAVAIREGRFDEWEAHYAKLGEATYG